MRSISLIAQFRWLILLGIAGCCTLSFAQRSDSLRVSSRHQSHFDITSSRDTTFVLPDQFIISGSETVFLDTVKLSPGFHFQLDVRFGLLRFNASTLARFMQDTSAHVLIVSYLSLPFDFKKSYQHRIPVVRIDTVSGGKIQVAKPASSFSFDQLFSSNLQKSGSIVRGLSIGSNRDLSLTSGFRMQMSGNITNDLEILAALTDENSPIQPEGTTQTLQEIDKVFIELRGENLTGTLGDFNLSLAGNEFGLLNRKLQGAKGVINYHAGSVNGDFLVSGAVTKGRFTTNQFEGIDGVQGPYRLTGQGNERAIIVIAGTERVYVNGEKMTRGEISDYTIDYGNAELTFTPRRLIARGSRIVVDFEYTDRRFNRSLFAAKSGTNFFHNKVSFNATIVRETDDEDSPIDVTISDSDKVFLQNAGDDRTKASRSGVQFVGQGKGQYFQVDTLIHLLSGADTLVTVYRYDPNDTIRAVYSINFSFVGDGNGNYRKRSLGNYEFAGLRQGGYEPVRFLPMPQSHTLTDFDVSAQLSDEIQVTGEYALTKFDPNKYSSLDDDHHIGSALKFGMRFSPKNVRMGQTNLGSFDLSVKERFVGKQFVPIDRTNEVEFNRKWNIVDTSLVDEELREGMLSYQPNQSLTIVGGAGWIKRGDPFSSNRYTLSGRLEGEQLPVVQYDLELINSHNSNIDLSGRWTRQRGTAQQELGWFTPHLRFADEYLSNRSLASDTFRVGSYRYDEILPGISVGRREDIFLDAEFGWRWDDSLASSSLQRASKTFTQHYASQVNVWQSLSSTLDVTLQNRKFTELFRQRNNKDAETILLRWQTRFNPPDRAVEGDWFYEVATERTARLERVFQRVPKGTGSYVYLGDANGSHSIDPADFQLSRFDGDFIALTFPTDELIPVVDLKASTRVRFNGEKIFTSDGWMKSIVSPLSSETYFRVEEKSSEPDTRQIYLLHFSHFLSEQNTLDGNNLFSQDLFFQENKPEFSLRLRYTQRRGLVQFASLNEQTYTREQSIRLRWHLVPEISNQVDYILKRDQLAASQASNRTRSVVSSMLSSEWSYRPEQKVELGFSVSVGTSTNFDTTTADLNDETVRLVYSFDERGQAKSELTREEVLFSRTGNLIPFELSGGKLAGSTWLWRLAFDYRINKFMQATLGYDGRSEGDRSPVHTARAEVRAFF